MFSLWVPTATISPPESKAMIISTIANSTSVKPSFLFWIYGHGVVRQGVTLRYVLPMINWADVAEMKL